jgi:predicted DNA-binding ribbon-helix-helix protein
MHSSVVKRSVFPAGHKTSVSLEDDFWKALKEISGARQKTQSALIHEIDQARQQGNLSSAIRLFVLKFYRGEASATVNDNMSRTRRRAPETEKRRRQGSLPLQQQSKQAAWITIGTGYQPQSLPRSLTAGVLAVGKDAHAEKNLVSAPHDTEGLASAINASPQTCHSGSDFD